MSEKRFCEKCGAQWSLRHADKCPYCEIEALKAEVRLLRGALKSISMTADFCSMGRVRKFAKEQLTHKEPR